MTGAPLIIVDTLPSYRRVALLRGGMLDQIWMDDAALGPYQTGAIVAVRISQKFTQHNRATVTLGDHDASLRLAANHAHKPGDIIAAAISSAPRNDGFGRKPLQLKEVGHIAPRDLPKETGIITPAPDALARATAAAPDAEIHHDDTMALWNGHDIDLGLESALRPHLDLPQGGRIAISTPPGAAVIDGDSATSLLAPQALAEAMVPAAMRQLRLRRIGGPIVIDFPRLDDGGMKSIHTQMRAEAKYDPLKPSLHGFTRGGLYTMARPWRDRLLADEVLPNARAQGLQVFRCIRAHQASQSSGSLTLRLHSDGLHWINGDGRADYQTMMASAAFMVDLIADDDCVMVARDG